MKQLYSLLAAICFTALAYGQIPNGGFEVWDSSAGYKMPSGWANLNAVTAPYSTLSCERGAPGYEGNYFIEATSRLLGSRGTVPGIAVSGTLDTSTFIPVSGFPYTLRPAFLTGVWQYMAMAINDKGYVAVYLTRWNIGISKRDTIGSAYYGLPGMVMSWERFFLPINYISSSVPDSAMIVLSGSGAGIGSPVAGSYVWADDLKFVDSVALNTAHAQTASEDFRIFPSPAVGTTHLSYTASTDADGLLEVISTDGKVIWQKHIHSKPGANDETIDISHFCAGTYFVKLTGQHGYKTRTLIVQ